MIIKIDGFDQNSPVRVVLNNSTFTSYSGFQFTDMRRSFNIQKSTIFTSSEHKNCFVISESPQNQATFCDFGLASTANFYAEWSYDFNLFKFQCHQKNLLVNATWADEMNAAVAKAKDQMKVDMVNKIREKEKEKESDPLKVKKEGDITLSVLNKELDIETLLEKEELQREKEQSDDLDYKVELEKKKENCIMKAIKEREIENQFNLRKKGEAEEVNNMRNVAKRQVKIRRDYLKKRLENLKRKADKKNELRKAQIMGIRMEIANKISDAYHKGNHNNCQNALKDNAEWNLWCQSKFMNADQAGELNVCKAEKDRCHYCCEKEFGDLYIDERDHCIAQYCKPDDKFDINGRWVWRRDLESPDGQVTPQPNTPPSP